MINRTLTPYNNFIDLINDKKAKRALEIGRSENKTFKRNF